MAKSEIVLYVLHILMSFLFHIAAGGDIVGRFFLFVVYCLALVVLGFTVKSLVLGEFRAQQFLHLTVLWTISLAIIL